MLVVTKYVICNNGSYLWKILEFRTKHGELIKDFYSLDGHVYHSLEVSCLGKNIIVLADGHILINILFINFESTFKGTIVYCQCFSSFIVIRDNNKVTFYNKKCVILSTLKLQHFPNGVYCININNYLAYFAHSYTSITSVVLVSKKNVVSTVLKMAIASNVICLYYSKGYLYIAFKHENLYTVQQYDFYKEMYKTCSANENSLYNCSCPVGYHGNRCVEDVDECETDPCRNSSKVHCINTYGSYKCVCFEGYKQKECIVFFDFAYKYMSIKLCNNGTLIWDYYQNRDYFCLCPSYGIYDENCSILNLKFLRFNATWHINHYVVNVKAKSWQLPSKLYLFSPQFLLALFMRKAIFVTLQTNNEKVTSKTVYLCKKHVCCSAPKYAICYKTQYAVHYKSARLNSIVVISQRSLYTINPNHLRILKHKANLEFFQCGGTVRNVVTAFVENGELLYVSYKNIKESTEISYVCVMNQSLNKCLQRLAIWRFVMYSIIGFLPGQYIVRKSKGL